MKQCAHCGWETAKPTYVSIKVREDFIIRVSFCPECLELYNSKQNKEE